MNTMQRVLAAVFVLAASSPAWAGIQAVPEPETLALLAIGAAAVAIVRWRKK
jgi:hypothetical protein